MNPSSSSGRGMHIWKQLEPVFQERKIPYRLMLSTHNGHIAELAAEVTSDERSVNLIILGGDGTVNEALQGIRDFSKANIGFIPTGSGNDLARDMRLGKEPLKILNAILNKDMSRRMDLGKLSINSHADTSVKKGGGATPDERFFVVSSGIGFDAAVCEEALSSRLKDVLNKFKLGKLTYLGIALKQLLTAKNVQILPGCRCRRRTSRCMPGRPSSKICYFSGITYRFFRKALSFSPDISLPGIPDRD